MSTYLNLIQISNVELNCRDRDEENILSIAL